MHGHHLIALTLAVSLVAGCRTERPMTAPIPVATSEPTVEGTVVGDDRTAMEAAIDAGPSSPAGDTQAATALSPDHKFLYSVNEQGQGTVSAFGLDSGSGKLTFLNSVSSKGESPCHIVVSKEGKSLYSANYSAAQSSCFRLARTANSGKPRKS